MPKNFRPAAAYARSFSPALTKAQTQRPEPRKVGVAVVPLPNAPAAKTDVALYRRWADSNEWIRTAIDMRKKQLSGAPWDIIPIDAEASFDPETQLRIISLFSRPNPKTESFRTLVEQTVEDLLVLDAGCIEIQHYYDGSPAALWPVDGAAIRVSRTWTGEEPYDPRYFFYPQGRLASSLLDRDLIYMMQSPSTHRVTGLSPLETLREAIDAEMQSSRYNKGQVMQAPPQGIIDLGEDATIQNVDQFDKYWRAEISGLRSTAIIGGTKNPKFINFGRSQKDMQFLQWQTYLIRKIAGVFGISPQDLGILFDVNRANAEQQADSSEDRGLRPLINLVENHFNREVVGEFQRLKARQLHWRGELSPNEMKAAMLLSFEIGTRTESRMQVFAALPKSNVLNLKFRFKIPSGRNTAARAGTHKLELGGLPWTTINAVRDEELLDPVEGGDDIIIVTPMGPIRLTAVTGKVPPSPIEQAFLAAYVQAQHLTLGSPTPPVAAIEAPNPPPDESPLLAAPPAAPAAATEVAPTQNWKVSKKLIYNDDGDVSEIIEHHEVAE